MLSKSDSRIISDAVKTLDTDSNTTISELALVHAHIDDLHNTDIPAIKTDTAALVARSTIATGTFTTSSTTVPADSVLGGLKTSHNYYNGCILMPLTGNCAYQPRKIKTYTGTTGVFTLATESPFTANTGLVTYVILADTALIELNTLVPSSPTAGSLYDILSKAAGTNTFDKSTDSLEAISDKITVEAAKLTAGITQTTSKTTIDASSTAWTIAAHRLFAITGVVKIHEIFGVVTSSIVEGAETDNTLSIGTAADVDVMIGVTAADLLVANDIWGKVSGGSVSKHLLLNNAESFIVMDTDIDLDVLGTSSITGGVITFYCTWTPISVGAVLVGVVWD